VLRNYFLINLILFIVIGLSGFMFYKVWVRPLDIETQTEQQLQTDEESLIDTKESVLDRASYDVIVDKDLFRPSRTAPNAGAAADIYSAKETPQLFRTIIKNDKKIAILQDPATKTSKLYYINDSVAGFIVSDIQQDRVTLKKGDVSIEVKLRDLKTFKPPARKLRQPKPAARSQRSTRKSLRTPQYHPPSRRPSPSPPKVVLPPRSEEPPSY